MEIEDTTQGSIFSEISYFTFSNNLKSYVMYKMYVLVFDELKL